MAWEAKLVEGNPLIPQDLPEDTESDDNSGDEECTKTSKGFSVKGKKKLQPKATKRTAAA